MNIHLPSWVFCFALTGVLILGNAPGNAQSLTEHAGDTIPLNLSFVSHTGDTVVLKDLLDRPVLLSIVFYRCASVCHPYLRSIAKAINLSDNKPGPGYRILTVSFDHTETPRLARNARDHMVGQMVHDSIPIDSWMFLTGDSLSIAALTQSVGYYFAKVNGEYVHPVVLIALSPRGQIIRYINGQDFLPSDLQMAVYDAAQGNVRSFMKKVQRICYSYDPKGRTYVLQVNRIILAVTGIFVAGFLFFIFRMGKGRKK